ncbi:TIGR04282 family arsenosugar biosynthesis glycosyltransferase [uncultured Dokdonia sp.]|uniref:TIGR04282 family arsenosugar biosynthesis glycosyltransferase n=1 Tax=uncultured Dokdonia sp. TaxID=575653 RepID=UPI002618DB6C|nr:TIGR04282 family arsenosugar biosynthesis glycosyltransferase [uncultured Dokdonia sp.]
MSTENKNNLLLIFTRNPELGKVKTRLAKGVGQENALTIYKELLQHTHDVVIQNDCTKRVGYSVKVREQDLWEESFFEKFQQQGDDLGQRMEHAFTEGFSDNYKKIVIIGSDLYDLQPHHLKEAFDALTTHDTVIGPAKDGGYYLLGMRFLITDVFKNKEWGGDTVLENTLKDLSSYTIHTLEELNDIDFAEDLTPYPEFANYINQLKLQT